MQNDTLEIVRQTISSIMQELYIELEMFMKEKKLQGRLGAGAWIPGDIGVTGWVDYLPHSDPNEEALNIIVDVYPNNEKVEVIVNLYLCWSDGVVIKDFVENKIIALVNSDVLIIEITNLFVPVKNLILTNMKNEMVIERLPVYRKI